jgi:alpha/beta superfamily hydrolase
MAESRATITCGNLALEGKLSLPEGEAACAGVVVCHPHPLYGGTMDNNIVIAVSQALAQASIASLRFNFRGVGESQGFYSEGIGEQDDVKAAIGCLISQEAVDLDRIGLCGYSFGAGVALDVAAKDPRVKALALVSPILAPSSPVESYAMPKLLLWGSQDLALPDVDLKKFTDDLPDPKQFKVISGADHMWWGYEDKVGERVAEFFTSSLPQPPRP